MEQEVLLKDVLPYIWVWTLIVVSAILVLAYRLWRFGKKHPEIFQPNTATENKQQTNQKADLQRQYSNQSLVSISVIFIWMIGMVVICFSADGSAPTVQGGL